MISKGKVVVDDFEGRGTGTAIALAHESIAKGHSNGQYVSLVLRDVKAAFDKVWMDGLRFKLGNLRMDEFLVRILSSYLEGRKGCVQFRGLTGESFNIRAGVPQGSILSPTLYNIYIHDLPEPPGHTRNYVYADDISQVIITRPRKEYHNRILTQEIERINNYENKWKIKTNINKFKIIHLDKREHLPVTINNKVITPSASGSMLGLVVSRTGYSTHIKQRVESARADLRKLWSLRELNSQNKRKIYNALITSKLTYPAIPLHCLNITSLRKLQIIQNQGARLITKTRRIDRKTNFQVNREAQLRPISENKKDSNSWA